ncbi:MAG: LLM class flavin-dependent oxidoreductase [Gammaproteobacteria bacterium]|nr:LLM class flavin-dependent oxidoreductase [Gammaproteobacteria bacterium]
MKLGVLDQSPIARGEDARTAVDNTIRLAQECEAFGYHRYWIAEHHASSTLASSTPEILITRVARETDRIRIGSGGVMLPHYSPFKVAENFRMLELMYPGRIDLGVGRAPGSDGLTAAALAYGNPLGIEYYPAKVKDLVAFVSGEKPFTEAFERLRATPNAQTTPDIWMLGSSLDSAVYAGRFGLAFSFAHFIAPQPTVAAMQRYRDEFQGEHLTAPYCSVGVFAIATEDPERADLFRRMREIQRIRRDRGIRGPPPTLEEAAAAPFSDEEMEQLRGRRSRQIIGSGAEVKAGIDALVEETQADEVVVLTITPSFDDRVKSYELIADAYRESATPPGPDPP